MIKVGLIGCGVVGSALKECFEKCDLVKMIVYDKYQSLGSLEYVAQNAQVIFLCLPTPTNGQGQDLSAIHETLLFLEADGYKKPVIIKSTVIPGTCDSLQEQYPGLELMHNPEFLTEKNAKEDFANQKCILLSGGKTGDGWANVLHIYGAAIKGSNHFYHSHMGVTEMAKYIHNCTLAVKVALMNEFRRFSADSGIHYDEAVKMAISQGGIGETHTRVPGPDGKLGFGGMCFIKDTEALLSSAPDDSYLSIIRAAVESNRRIRPGAYDGTERTGINLD